MQILVVGLIVGLAATVSASESVPERVIWITIDSLRADHLHFMGYAKETSPWLDKFAGESAAFRLAISGSHTTDRSVTAYFTGKFGSQLLDKQPPFHIPESETTVAELFHAAGFRTLAFITNRKLSPGMGFDWGFDSYDLIFPYSAPKGSLDELIDHIRGGYTPSGGKEFIYIHTMDVHLPYRPPMPYDRMFAPSYSRAVVRYGTILDDHECYVLSNFPYYSEGHDVQASDIEFLISQYDGAIRYTDNRLPELLSALAYNPQRDLVVVTADHGEQFFEHGFWGHGRELFLEEIHVPLIIHYEGFTSGPRTHAVSLMDLLPTFADILGVTLPSGLTGTSLLGLLRGGQEAERFVISEHCHRCIPGASVVGEGYLYHLNGMAHVLYPWRVWPFIEGLYGIASDPGCTRSTLAGETPMAGRLNTILRQQNPRFDWFTTEHIRGSDGDVKFGPNSFPESIQWIVQGTGVRVLPGGECQLAPPEAQAYVQVAVDEPMRPYLLEVEYELEHGALVFRLQKNLDDVFRLVPQQWLPIDESVSWHYECRKPTGGSRTLQSVVYPRAAQMYFIAAFAKPGVATVKSLRLRRAFVPEMAGGIYVPLANLRSAGPELTPDEKASLRAIGYVE